jgi:hypothetical protein
MIVTQFPIDIEVDLKGTAKELVSVLMIMVLWGILGTHGTVLESLSELVYSIIVLQRRI